MVDTLCVSVCASVCDSVCVSVSSMLFIALASFRGIKNLFVKAIKPSYQSKKDRTDITVSLQPSARAVYSRIYLSIRADAVRLYLPCVYYTIIFGVCQEKIIYPYICFYLSISRLNITFKLCDYFLFKS